MRRTILGAALLTLTAVPAPSAAAPRCQAVATGLTAGACEYEASGPGNFVVSTASGFIVSIWKVGDTQFRTYAQSAGPIAMTAPLPTAAGDRVSLAIRHMDIRDYHGQRVATIQNGYITAVE